MITTGNVWHYFILVKEFVKQKASLRIIFSSLCTALAGKGRAAKPGAGLKRAADKFMAGDSRQSYAGRDKEKQFSCLRAEGRSPKTEREELHQHCATGMEGWMLGHAARCRNITQQSSPSTRAAKEALEAAGAFRHCQGPM